MHHVNATNASVYMNFQPVVAAIVSIVMGQDIFTWDKPLAAVLVISEALIVSLGAKMKFPQKAKNIKNNELSQRQHSLKETR